jgi:hypothetical protein
MREAKFSHDFLSDSEFRGYTRDRTYNGFACPYFSYDQAMLRKASYSPLCGRIGRR